MDVDAPSSGADSSRTNTYRTACETLPREFYERSSVDVAPDLLGYRFLHRTPEGDLGGTIVETEAYGPDDPANHAYRGPTPRNAAMFGSAGTVYVYRIYGFHWCVNVVTGQVGQGEAVLVRALEPVDGIAEMRARRGVDDVRRLCSGPGRLCAALGITGALDGTSLSAGPLLVCADRADVPDVVATTRVGITRAADRRWRYYIAGSPYVSRR